MIIRRVGVLSIAKISAIIAAVVGLLLGILIFLGSLAGGGAAAESMAGTNEPGMAWLSGLGIFAIIVLPILYGIVGFIGGAIQGFVYNIAAKFVGGISIETE